MEKERYAEEERRQFEATFLSNYSWIRAYVTFGKRN